jgi:hypothetical protein
MFPLASRLPSVGNVGGRRWVSKPLIDEDTVPLHQAQQAEADHPLKTKIRRCPAPEGSRTSLQPQHNNVAMFPLAPKANL